MMKKMQTCILSLALIVATMAGNVINVMAKEQTQTAAQHTTDSYQPVKSMLYVTPQNVGETVILHSDENGTLSVTLDSYCSGSKSRSSNTQEDVAVYTFTHTNILGVTSDAYRVTMTCNWENNGSDSKINKLSGVYEIINSSFSCEWTNSSYTEYFCYLDLRATKGSTYADIRFTALLLATDEPSLSMGVTAI